MKELSIQEKAKRYDEAIERAKNFIENGDESERTIAESIFAGIMEESEDERIRKALMQNLKERFGIKGNMGEGLDMPDVLAWFEKQGEKGINGNDKDFPFSEQKPAWSEKDEDYCFKINVAVFDYYDEGYAKEMRDWLKSIKDRYIWKPNGEQMKILNEVLNFAANHESPHWNDYIFGALNNLIRQLKKL